MFRQVCRGYIQETKARCRSLAPDKNEDDDDDDDDKSNNNNNNNNNKCFSDWLRMSDQTTGVIGRSVTVLILMQIHPPFPRPV